ncbi:MAG TPA: efflux RND transporter periplasmic adaptor subunit [Longimicrobiales bacterium]|nr:efflux RND transporter periplasmic adaptor subunit [Longimicrobiales bacterium]
MTIENSQSIRSAALLAFVLGVAACGGSDQQAQATVDASDVVVLQPTDVATAQLESVAQSVVLTGTLNPYRVAEVRAQVPGLVSSIRVDRGDAVAAGQVMAVLDAQGIRSSAAGARAQVAAAEANVALAQQRFESSRKLYEAGAISQIDFQAAQAALEAARGQLAAAQAQSASASESARQATITAPFAGEVSSRMVNVGEAVNPGQALFQVVNTTALELAGQIPVREASRVQRGQPVEFTTDAYPGQVFVGEVERVEPVADPSTRRVGVYLRMPNPGRTLVGGLYATGRIVTGGQDSVVVIPSSALREQGGATFVWVIADGVLEQRPVNAGSTDVARGSVGIVSGLEPGEQVLIAPGAARAGAQVRISGVPAASPTEAEAEPEGAR